jgi:hypothetical protein
VAASDESDLNINLARDAAFAIVAALDRRSSSRRCWLLGEEAARLERAPWRNAAARWPDT